MGMAQAQIKAAQRAAAQPEPVAVDDYHQILQMPEIEAVVIMASWESHLNLACDAMRAGKYTAVEVGGAPVAIPDFTNGMWMERQPWQP